MFKTEAIILSKRKYSDNSFIVTFYCLEKGMLTALVRIPKSKTANLKQNLFFPLNIIDCEIEYKSTKNIQILKCCNRQIVLNEICNNIYKTCIAQFIAETILKSIKEEEANINLYNKIKTTILLLEKSTKFSNLHIAFLNEFSRILGFGITNNFCSEFSYFNLREGMFLPVFTTENESEDQNNSKIISSILELNLDTFENYNIKNEHKQIFLNVIMKYYKYHFNGIFHNKSLEILMEIFD